MRRVRRILPWPLAYPHAPWTVQAMHCGVIDEIGDSCITAALLDGLAKADQ